MIKLYLPGREVLITDHETKHDQVIPKKTRRFGSLCFTSQIPQTKESPQTSPIQHKTHHIHKSLAG